jgi:hypothetical protein
MHLFIKKIVVLFFPLLLLQVAQAQNRFEAFRYNDRVSQAPKAAGDPERRYLDINQELLNRNNVSSGDIITIQYEGRDFDFRVKKMASYMQDTYTIVATMGDRYLYFTVNNDKVIASIQIPEIRYQGIISHDPDLQMNYLYEHDHSMELSCGLDQFRDQIQGQIDSHMKSKRVGKASDLIKKMQNPNAQTTITLLIVYANGAGTWMAANGGINNVINQSMTMSQEAMDVSGTEITLDLVHSASVNYNEAGVSSNDILTFLRVKNDGVMDDVHTLRDTHQADVVSLFVDEGDTGGLGYLINQPTGDPDFAFNLNRVQQITDTYTLVHEIGHNMGSDHSRNQSASPADADGGVFPYSTGWRWIGTNGISYASVMTYASFPLDGVMSTRTPHFSNPNINFQGTPTGTSSLAVQYGPADNARSLREMKEVTAAYRQSTDQQTPVITTAPVTNITTSSATGGGNVTSQGSAAVTARGVCYATTQNPTTADQCVASGNGTGAFTANLTGLAPGTLYNVRAYATNTAGTSYGAQVSFTTNQSNIQLCDALDNCNLTFVTGGAASWFGQTQVSQDGVDAAQSGVITHEQESFLTTTVNGSGTLSFFWKVSSEPDFDFLELRIDGALDRRVSGEIDWVRVELNLPGPTHTVQWRYIKDESENTGLDRAWVDQVGFLANQTAPTVTTEAVTAIGTTTATAGGNVTSQGSAAVTARGVCYATTQNPTTADQCVASGDGTGAFTANLTGLTPGTLYNVRAYATNSAGTSYGAQVTFTTSQPNIQLCDALDNCNLTFVTGGAASWFGQTQVSQDGVDAAQSGVITHEQESFLTTTVNGSGTLSFFWKVSSEPDFDFLELRIDGALDRRVSGEIDWVRVELNLPGPTHTVQWRYIKDESENTGLDRAWVDQVGFVANQTAPTVTTEAVTAIGTTTATAGGNVTSQGSEAVTARGVCYATTQNPTTADQCVASGDGTGAFTANLTGLAPGTLYNVRAYATNTAGTSYGAQVSFTTATPAVAPTVTTAPITNIGTTAATGGGNVADGGNTAVTARGVCYATTENPTTADQCVASGSGTGAFSSSLTGLPQARSTSCGLTRPTRPGHPTEHR